MNGEVNGVSGKIDRGSFDYLTQLLKEFKGHEDFLATYAFGKRPVEKEFQMILDQYFNKDLQEFYDYLKDCAYTVCEISGRAEISDINLSTTVDKDYLELDGTEVLNSASLLERSVQDCLCYSDEIVDTGYVGVSGVEVDFEYLKLPFGVTNPELKDIIYGQEVFV